MANDPVTGFPWHPMDEINKMKERGLLETDAPTGIKIEQKKARTCCKVHPEIKKRYKMTMQDIVNMVRNACILETHKIYRYQIPSNTISRVPYDGFFSVSRVEYGAVLYAIYPWLELSRFHGDGPFNIKPGYASRFNICDIDRFVEIINYNRTKKLYALPIPDGHRRVPEPKEVG